MAARKIPVRTRAASSAAATDSQIPSTPSARGRSTTLPHWNTSVRRKEMRAEIRPLLRAVKKAEPKMFSPENRKDRANSRRPRTVSASRSGS